MSSLNYLFGNIDKQGRLEKDEGNQDLQQILESKETAEYLEKVFETIQVPVSNDEEEIVKPLGDAVDYQDIQEMAEDLNIAPQRVDVQFFKPMDMGFASTMVKKPKIQGRVKFSEIFASHTQKSTIEFRQKPLPCTRDEYYSFGIDHVDLFSKTPQCYRFLKKAQPHEEVLRSAIDEDMEDPLEEKIVNKESAIHADLIKEDPAVALSSVMLDPWEEKIIWDLNDTNDQVVHQHTFQMFRNERLDGDEWLDSVIWDTPEDVHQPAFHMDDPTLVVLQSQVDKMLHPSNENMSMVKKGPDGKMIDKFNISDDHKYVTGKTKLGRIRQQHGPVKLQHSLPATKLHPHYFKPLLHVKELRSFHRPTIKFPITEPIGFTKVRSFKKKKFRAIDPGEMMRTPKDLTLKDTAKFVMIEYSEEYPPSIQNVGMASLIYNYYQKKDEKDNFVPKCENGGAFILEAEDVSPFFGFGDVAAGQTLQVLYNNLVRAPIFPQDVPQTDFLAIRHTYRDETKYYLREIPNMYVAGQCYPVQEVPRPQARKITQALKMRLQVAGYRLMRADPHHRLQYDKLRQQFPMFTDLQIRQKLKEFAQYLKKGENTGWWKLKPNLVLLDEDGIRKMVTPESICLQESTLHGAQRLRDAGYGAEDMKEMADDENESALDVEVQLAPWTTTKNFIIAASGKGMVQLFGPGDPTGIGEGFSYIRASMKEMFFHHSETEATRNAFIDNKTKLTYHKYSILEQQKVYRQEIDRIWNAQLKSLSLRESEDKRDSVDSFRKQRLALEKQEEEERQDQFGMSAESSPAPYSPPAITQNDDAFSDVHSVHGSTLAGKNKMLVINRLVRDETGKADWKSEVITDARVINAYLRHRRMIEKPPPIIEGAPDIDIDIKARRSRRTHAHIVRLQIKQGKKPPLNDDEDISESELPGEIVQKPLPVMIKVPTGMNAPVGKKGKRGGADAPLVYKVATKRRTSPECDLAEILEKIISEVIAVPEAFEFCRPVSHFNFPDYYEIVKNPLSLEQIRDKVRNFKYLAADCFLEDILRVADNCNLYNGPAHPLTGIARKLYEKAQGLVSVEKEKLEALELELKGQKPEDAVKTEAELQIQQENQVEITADEQVNTQDIQDNKQENDHNEV